jgi:uncharacterized membrane protein
MNSSSNKAGFATILLATLGASYPFVVYFALGRVPTGALVLVALALAVGRLVAVRGSASASALLPPLAAVAIATAGLGVLSAEVAAKAYPVLMSLAFAAAFGLSLLKPPSLVEVFAALSKSEPAPSPQARAYMRRVSVVWFGFLLANAAASAATALWAETWAWALYNGFLSYVLMGVLFAGEWLVRCRVRARHAAQDAAEGTA